MTDDVTLQDAYPILNVEDLTDLGETLVVKPEPFKQGRYGWLYELHTHVHRDAGRQIQMLKVLKPAYGLSAVERVNDDFEREITALGRLGGTPGIPKITWSGKVNVSGQKHPAFAYVKISPAVTLTSIQGRHFTENEISVPATSQTLFDIGLRLLETLKTIHAAGIRHLDIHPSNILVSQETSIRRGTPPFNADVWLIDFGKASVPLDHAAVAQLSNGMVEFMTRDQMKHLIANNGRYAYEIDVNVLRESRSAAWDLNAVGVCFRLTATKFAFRPEEAPHHDALMRFADILQDESDDYELRLEKAISHAEIWRNAVPKLNSIKVRTFVAAHASLEPLLVPILDSFPVQRLRRVQQLALTQLLYPGATHTRFAHTVGVVDLADRYIQKINTATPLSVISGDERLVCLAYALVHDIGHYPFAHYLEEIDHQSLGPVGPLLHHERVGRAMYSPDQPLSRLFSPQLRSALEYTIPSFDDLTFSHHLGPENQRTHIGQIVDGPIDADKVDYLVRDGNACGISYANGIDIERLLDSIRLVQSRDARHLGVSIKGLASASELYYTRFHMYAEVYYHKVSRSIAAATKRAFLRVIDHRAPDPLQLVEVLLRSSELQVVDYLLEQLRKIEQGRYAPMLDDPFGRNGRKLLKRIRTYSDVWLQNADRSQERVVLDILREQAMSFRNVGLLETAICDKLDSSGLMPKDSRACILVDVPPPKNISRFPFVVDARGISYLNQANPVVESAAVAQRTSQRVRIFASRATHEALQRKYPRSDSLDRYLDERIVEAVQSIRLASQS